MVGNGEEAIHVLHIRPSVDMVVTEVTDAHDGL